MRTTIDIDPRLLKEAMEVTGARTRREAIHRSLTEIIRRKRVEELAGMIGTGILELTAEDLERMRADD